MENSKVDQENSPESSEDIDITEIQRLEIEQLKKDLAYHKSILAELKEQNSHKDIASLCHSSKDDNLKTNIYLQGDLYRFAGMHCVKLDTACVFQFLSGSQVTKNDIYAVELVKINGHQRLGRWVMPMSIDLNDIVLEYPLENPKNMKPFLKLCKHHIDCYYSRREQFYQLKEFLSDAKNCFLDTTLGYLQVHLHMSGIQMIDSKRIYNVSLYMGYDSDRAFPFEMTTELREGKLLPPEVVPHFSKYFKPFKKQNLREAFEKVISDTRFFQWKKELYDSDDGVMLTDSKRNEEEYDEKESDELDEPETLRKLSERKDEERSKKTNVANDFNDDVTNSEERSSGEKSLSSEEGEGRSKPNRNVNKARARENANTKERRNSKRIPNSTAENANIMKYLKSKVKSTTEENSKAIEEKTMMEKSKENSKEGENSKERENSIEKENSKEKEVERMDKTDTMINPTGDVKNDNVEISNDGNDKTIHEVEKNVPLNKTTPVSKSSEEIESKLVERLKKGKHGKKNKIRKSNANNLSTKSITNGDVARDDKESTMIPTNVRRSIISSTPISSKVQAKLYTSQCSEISEISTNARSKKVHTDVEQDIPNEQMPQEDPVSSSSSDDISDENEYEEAKELLKNIQNVLEKDQGIKKNIQQRNVKKVKRKKQRKVT